MANTQKVNKVLLFFSSLLAIIIGFVAGFWGYSYYSSSIAILKGDSYSVNNSSKKEDTGSTIISGELSIHFLELGNSYAGDCIYIKAGDNDILVDAGSRSNSINTISTYINKYCTDGVLEYVIVTHADQDHIACFAGSNSNKSIFDLYKCKTIIDFALTNKTTATYNRYITNRDNEVENDGATHYTALQCYKQTDGASRIYDLGNDISIEILYNYYYENKATDENNYSVCFMLKHGSRNFLFTGDLEKDGEECLVENNTLPQVELYKAGHHGSKTSSNTVLLEVIQPKIVCVCCCAGSVEYTQNLENTFPTQAFIDRIANYTQKVYVTTMIETVKNEESGKYENSGTYQLLNGNIVVLSNQSDITVNCSNSNNVLKDTDWFKNNRDCPTAWQGAS